MTAIAETGPATSQAEHLTPEEDAQFLLAMLEVKRGLGMTILRGDGVTVGVERLPVSVAETLRSAEPYDSVISFSSDETTMRPGPIRYTKIPTIAFYS